MPQAFSLNQTYHPTTFLDRGVSVPLTTPLLAGTRARPGERGGLDLIVPNPSGGRGVYILPWAAINDLCRPTLHDRMLTERIAALKRITPSGLRRVAREVAIEGLAGRQASAAASLADKAEAEAAIITNFHLLLAFIEQTERPEENEVPPEREHPVELERRAKRATARVGPRLGMTTDGIGACLEEMSIVFSQVGVGPRAGQARMPRLLAQLGTVQEGLARWAGAHMDESGSWAAMAANAAEMTINCTRPILAEAQALGSDVSGLLRTWRGDSATVMRKVIRPDWLLDGWEAICLLWQNAGTPAQRRLALGEIALLVPVMPAEVGEWLGNTADLERELRYRRLVDLNEDWRTGASILDLIARNEHLLALAV